MYIQNKISIYYITLLIPMVLFTGAPFAANRGDADKLSSLRSHISNTIDSLDIEKQLRKRSGENFEDIESQQQVLIDSLNVMKSEIQNNAGKTVVQNKTGQPFPPFRIDLPVHPGSFFDWLILVSSAVAALSFLILLFVVWRAIRNKSIKYGDKEQGQPKHKATYASKAYSTGHLPQLKDAALPNGNTAPSMDRINQIRLKIKETSDFYDKAEPRPSTQILKAQLSDIQEQRPGEDLGALVFDAYNNGTQIHEISKKFQLSEDHVSLLLKMRGVNLKKE